MEMRSSMLLLVLGLCAAPANAGISLYYRFDGAAETEGLLSKDTTVKDFSGNGYDGVMKTVCSARPAWDETKDFLPAYVFEDNFIRYGVGETRVANAGSLDFARDAGTGNTYGAAVAAQGVEALMLKTFTVEFFVKSTDSHTAARNFFVIGTQNANSTIDFCEMGWNKFWISAYVTDASSGEQKTQTITTSTVTSFNDGKWHHIAVSLDDATHVMKIYVDYDNVVTATLDGSLYYYPGRSDTWNLRVGAGGNCTRGYKGQMDEFRVSDEVLTPTDFLRLEKRPEALLHYTFDAQEPGWVIGRDTVVSNSVADRFHGVMKPVCSANADWNPLKDFLPAFSAVPQIIRNADGSERADGGCFDFAVDADESTLYGAAVSAQSASDLMLKTFTAECLVNSLDNNVSVRDLFVIGTHNSNSTFDFGERGWKKFWMTAYVTDSATGEQKLQTFETKELTPFNDGKWHHVGVTVDDASHALKIYLDYELADSFALDGSLYYYPGRPDTWNLRVGAGGNCTRGYKGLMDEFRVTDGVLAPDAFLRFVRKPKSEHEVLFYATMDGNFDDTLYPGLVGKNGVVQTDGTQAEIVSDFWKVRVAERGGDVTIREANLGSMKSTAGDLRWGRVRLLEEEEDFTVEFFVRKSDVKADDCLIGYTRALKSWEDESGRLSYQSAWHIGTRRDIAEKYNQLAVILNTGASLGYGERKEICCNGTERAFDGKWHHIGVTFKSEVSDDLSATNTLVDIYLDGVKVGSGEAAGRILYNSNINCVGLRMDDLRGQMDELRISRGVLPVSKFLRARTGVPTLILIR